MTVTLHARQTRSDYDFVTSWTGDAAADLGAGDEIAVLGQAQLDVVLTESHSSAALSWSYTTMLAARALAR